MRTFQRIAPIAVLAAVVCFSAGLSCATGLIPKYVARVWIGNREWTRFTYSPTKSRSGKTSPMTGNKRPPLRAGTQAGRQGRSDGVREEGDASPGDGPVF